jgi:outer membrane lipoprotein-sorting protein
LSSTPAGILVEDHVSLTAGDLKVTAFDQDGGWWRLTVVRTESPGDGTLTLTFRENPLELKQWIVVDAQGTVTQVSLQDAAFDVPLDPALFQFRDPRIFREGR